jgi:hypothetical protein
MPKASITVSFTGSKCAEGDLKSLMGSTKMCLGISQSHLGWTNDWLAIRTLCLFKIFPPFIKGFFLMLGWSKAVMGWLWSKVKNWGSKVFDIMQEGKKFFHMKENALLYYDEISLG